MLLLSTNTKMTKEMVKWCDVLKRKLEAELKEIKESMGRDNRELRRDFKELNQV